MKNIIVTPKRQKKELIIWGLSLLVAIGINIYSIIQYNTNWSELYSQFGYVIALSFILYALTVFVRGLFRLFRLLTRK